MTDEKKRSIGVLCLLIVLYSIAAAPILAWPLVFFFSIFMFDNPDNMPFTFAIFIAINSYPFIIAGFITGSILCFLWRKNILAIILALIPSIAMSIVIGLLVNLYFEYEYAYLERDTFATKQERQLITVCATGSADELGQLLEESGPGFVNIVGTEGMTPLLAACKSKRYDNAEVLLKQGANPNLMPQGKLEKTAVCSILGYRDSFLLKDEERLDYFRLLLDHGLNPNLNDSKSCVLFKAVSRWDPQILQLLLQRGADPGVVHDGQGVLSVGISKRSWKNVLYLLENYPDLPLDGVQKALDEPVIKKIMAREAGRDPIQQILPLLRKRNLSLRL